MKDRPILFSGEMVRAILDGRKTQTRRVMKPEPRRLGGEWLWDHKGMVYGLPSGGKWDHMLSIQKMCPFGQPGEVLWVRETWKTSKTYDPFSPSQIDSGAAVKWMADGSSRLNGPENWGKTRVSIHMPRWASRINLEITGIRCERLNDISEKDAFDEGTGVVDREGVMQHAGGHPSYSIGAFKTLWESINGPGSWDVNPFVWVVEFKKLEATWEAT